MVLCLNLGLQFILIPHLETTQLPKTCQSIRKNEPLLLYIHTIFHYLSPFWLGYKNSAKMTNLHYITFCICPHGKIQQ